ncbi:protein toll-like [Rhagoletis pomonella]|uniref:protein toll-like n=1 Tax=Rhagoletis pomonella TaxID=28610 RepID=UPI001786CD69|nr:protein toll-like [Rhagoletis pomonella]
MNRFHLHFIKILTFSLALHYRFSAAVITYPQCDQLQVETNCSCKRDIYVDMEIVCPLKVRASNNSDGIVTIAIYRSAQVQVTCQGKAQEADGEALATALPSLPVGPDLMLLATRGCTNGFDTILRRLSIRKARLLELSAGATATNTNLTRQQLPTVLPVDNLKLTAYTRLAADLFADNARLKFLEIEASYLHLPPAVFQSLPSLVGLTLKAHISRLPLETFRAQHRLLNVVFSDGALQSLLTADFQHLPKLQSLHLPRNQLDQVPAHTFAPLNDLLRINLSENRLRALPANMLEHQSKLVYIDLSENQLQALSPELFTHTQRLRELRLSHNQLQSIPSELLAPLNFLKLLHLNNNALRDLHPHTFANNTELQYLHLQHNRIELSAADMCATLVSFTELSELLLRNNSLTHLCAGLPPRRMGRIDLSHNRIGTLRAPELVALACSWARVDLSHNALQTIILPSKLNISLEDMPALKCQSNIALNENALHCDCQLLDFVLQSHRRFLSAQTQLNTTNLSCGSPATLRGRLVDTLQPSELLCPVVAAFCPERCRCWARPHDATLIVNCTQTQLKSVPALPSLSKTTLAAIELHVTHNEIRALPLNSTAGYVKVTRIYAAYNQLSSIEAAQLPVQLTHLDVRANHLARLNNSFYILLNRTQTLATLYLSQNPWACDCDTEQLLIAAKVHHNRIRDLDELSCADPQYPKILELAFNDICPTDMTALFASISLLATGFLLAITSAFYFKYQLEVNVWLYAHNACLWCVTEHELDKDKVFDAFISYSHKDERFVKQELLPGLEQGDIPFRVCTHERNWLAGAYIPEQIVESVEQSRRTIIVLSQHFIESPWARMEFRTAHQSALDERRARIIIIMYSEVVNMDALDTELRAYLKMNTYLQWDDPWFWSKLRYAMPHKRRHVREDANAPRYVYSRSELIELGRRARGARH